MPNRSTKPIGFADLNVRPSGSASDLINFVGGDTTRIPPTTLLHYLTGEAADVLRLHLMNRFGLRWVEADEVYYSAGDEANGVLLSVTAGCKVYVPDSGRERLTDVIGPLGLIGEREAFSGAPRRWTTTRFTNRSVVMDLTGMLDTLRAMPEFNLAMAGYLAYQASVNERRWVRFRGPIRQRVARCLLDFGYDYSEQDQPIETILTQSEIADLTGASMPSIEKEFERLRRLRTVETYYGYVRLLDVDALRRDAQVDGPLV